MRINTIIDHILHEWEQLHVIYPKCSLKISCGDMELSKVTFWRPWMKDFKTEGYVIPVKREPQYVSTCNNR